MSLLQFLRVFKLETRCYDEKRILYQILLYICKCITQAKITLHQRDLCTIIERAGMHTCTRNVANNVFYIVSLKIPTFFFE